MKTDLPGHLLILFKHIIASHVPNLTVANNAQRTARDEFEQLINNKVEYCSYLIFLVKRLVWRLTTSFWRRDWTI